MKKFNESLLDLAGKESSKNISNFKVKKLRKSILDDLEPQQIQQPQQIVDNVISSKLEDTIIIPQQLQQYKQENFTADLQIQNRIQEYRKLALLRNRNKNVDVKKVVQEVIQNNIQKQQQQLEFQIQELQQQPQEIQVQKYPALQQLQLQLQVEKQKEVELAEINDALIETYEELTNTVLPENIDLATIVDEIQDAAENIPGSEDLKIDDFTIIENKKGSGWFKTKVSISSKLASKELSEIATIVKSATDNIVIHRAMDFRTIGNANKNQLKTSEFKLYAISYVFRPVSGTEIKASKYARIAISIPNDFNTTNRVLIFMQESRDKFVIEVNCDIKFLAKIISDFYLVGFANTKQKLQMIGQDNPLSVLSSKLMLTKNYLVAPIEDNDENSIIIRTKTGKHQWVNVIVKEKNIKNTYSIRVFSKIDHDWKGIEFKHPDGNNVPITMELLMSDRFIKNLEKLFNTMDWSQFGMGEDDIENKQYYLLSKLTYRALKKAFIEIYDLQSEENNTSGIFIKEALSQLDTAKDIKSGYKAEMIIGKSEYIDYFILVWSAVLIEGGDKRNGKDFITTDKYYEENFVNDRRDYSERANTVLKKQNSDRNYNSRPFQFTLTYSVGKEVKTIEAKTFDEIKELSGFLTTNPK